MEKYLLILIQGTIEVSGLMALSLALAKAPVLWGRVIPVAILVTILIWLIRLLPVTFGLHMIVAMLIYIFFIVRTTHNTIPKAFVVVLASMTILAFLEMSINGIYFTLTKTTPEQVIANDLLWKLLGLPQGIILILLSLLVIRIIKPAQGMWKI